jgi:hypothetical protein
MSKPRKTQVPLPGAQPKPRPKTQTKVLPPKSALSQEYVARDDDSSDEVAARPKPPVQIGIHPPKTNGAAKLTPKPAPKPKATSKPVVAAKPPATKVTPKKIVAEEQGADSTSSSEESEDEGTDIKAAQRRESAKKKSAPVDISSDSDSSSEESEEEAASKATLRTAARYVHLDVTSVYQLTYAVHQDRPNRSHTLSHSRQHGRTFRQKTLHQYRPLECHLPKTPQSSIIWQASKCGT